MENINGVLDFDGADLEAEEAEEFEALVDHEAGFDCDPYDVESYHAEAILAYHDQAAAAPRVTHLTPNKFDFLSKF